MVLLQFQRSLGVSTLLLFVVGNARFTTADSSCADTKMRFEVGGGGREACSFLKTTAHRTKYCSSGGTIDTQADAICPKTCGKCGVPCADSAKADFGTTPKGTKKTCAWLNKTQNKACKDPVPRLVCPESCGECRGSKPKPKPGPGPTPSPPGNSDGYGLWNYDPNDSQKGPGAWHKISDKDVAKLPDYRYWKQYEKEMKKQLPKGFKYNYCKGYEQSQSPIDLNNIVGVNTECFEYHQLRDWPGEYPLTHPNVELEIMPNKLRIQWPGKLDGSNPTCDIPKGWGHHYPVLHADVFLKSAHTINGRQYPGEYQLWVLTNRGRGSAVITTLIDEGEHNGHFEVAIQEWEKKFAEDVGRCQSRERRKLRGTSFNATDGRALQEPQTESTIRWDPFHKSIFTSYYWWGYRGTTMEPPCYPLTEYRVLDEPMHLSKEQLQRLRRLLFLYRDSDKNCELTSKNHGMSVARPVQPHAGRDLHRCTCIDYYPDKKRKQTQTRDCKADSNHPWFKKDCPEWYGGNCPTWYEG